MTQNLRSDIGTRPADRPLIAAGTYRIDAARSTLDRDPWSGSHLVVASVDRWTIRLDGREKS